MSVAENIKALRSTLPSHVTLVAISKTKPVELILEAYHAGQRLFGENKVQELVAKYEQLPKDIQWHLVGHLQSNKVKYIAPFISLIHSVDSLKLLSEINKEALKCKRVINCLLQVYIASEETKFGLSFDELDQLLLAAEFQQLQNIKVVGLMGMATNTTNEQVIKKEFASLKNKFDHIGSNANCEMRVLSMGMSSDYKLAIEQGSTLIRVGSSLFGERNYSAS